jgi:hypothetical protein
VRKIGSGVVVIALLWGFFSFSMSAMIAASILSKSVKGSPVVGGEFHLDNLYFQMMHVLSGVMYVFF